MGRLRQKEDEIHMAEQDDDDVWFKLDELVWSCAISQAVHVAVELGIPELLQAGRKSAGELAATTSSDEATLESILFALAAFDVLDMDDREHFSLTELGTLLLKSKLGIPEEAAFFLKQSISLLVHCSPPPKPARPPSSTFSR
jgi:hypothetical protein